jgi:hypothetical protein
VAAALDGGHGRGSAPDEGVWYMSASYFTIDGRRSHEVGVEVLAWMFQGVEVADW